MVIKESTQGRLGGIEVGVSNLWEREYALPDGTTRTGMAARLTLPEGPQVVGEGSVVTLGGQRFRVLGVDKPADGLGRVRFAPAE